MDNRDLGKNQTSGNDSHGVHVCYKCGWPFPNPHPSARHRRAHKKNCGTIEGYKLVDSQGTAYSVLLSDDELPSDEDRLKTPSPLVVQRSFDEKKSAGSGERTNRSEDDAFLDAVMEFSDSGSGPSGKGIEDSSDVVKKQARSVGATLEDDAKTVLSFEDDAITGKNTSEVVEKEKQCEQIMSSTTYKMPLVWIDLEMTGLDVEVDRILEIACIITDGNLTKSVEGPDLVVHQSKECLEKMGEWCQIHHAASGLTERVLRSTLSEREAENQVIEFVKRHIGAYTPLLAGNSVYMDFLFLKKYMPDLASLFSHRLVDVSSVRALCIRWYPRDHKKSPRKTNQHRALADIRESIDELRYYKENIFKAKSKK